MRRIGPLGLTLGYTYAGAAEHPTSGARRRFWVARFARIYPLYVFSLLVHAPFVIAYRFEQDGGGVGVLPRRTG